MQFECEFRRFNIDRSQASHFGDFYSMVGESHHLPSEMPFTISYTDPRNGDLLPITNNDNLLHAFSTALPLLRLLVYRKQGTYRNNVIARYISIVSFVELCM